MHQNAITESKEDEIRFFGRVLPMSNHQTLAFTI